MKNEHTKEIIRLTAANLISSKEGLISSRYRKSRFYEMVKLYKQFGETIFNHKQTHNKNARKYSDLDKIIIKEIYLTDGFNSNFKDFEGYLKLERNLNYTYSFIEKSLKEYILFYQFLIKTQEK